MTSGDGLFFTADLHIGHTRVLEYTRRPANSLAEMNEVLAERWNALVPKDGEVYVLGDVSFTRKKEDVIPFFKQLNRKSLYLVTGNHDDGMPGWLKDEFVWVKPYHEMTVADPMSLNGRQKLILFHYPIFSWRNAHHGSWHFHGHCHGSIDHLNEQTTRFDVGLDNPVSDFTPFGYADIAQIMRTRVFTPVDHHKRGTPKE